MAKKEFTPDRQTIFNAAKDNLCTEQKKAGWLESRVPT